MPAKKAEKPAKDAGKSKRGGARPGAGRKAKPITEIRAALIEAQPAGESTGADAAEYALALFVTHMREEGNPLDLRLDCAREVLNRTIGKPRIAEATDGKGLGVADQVHVYMPDNGRATA